MRHPAWSGSGWKPKTLKPGDEITIVTHPLRDGRPGGSLVSATLPDGTRIGGSPTGEPQTPESEMNTNILRLMCIAPCLLVASAEAQTTANSPARLEKFSKLPDWSGLWSLKVSPALLDVENGKPFVPGARDLPPYNAEWEAKYQEDLIRAEHQGDANFPNPLVDTHTIYCAAGMPHIIGTPFDYEFIVTPEETWIIVDKETRHIYTDGRGFPPEDELWGTMWADPSAIGKARRWWRRPSR